MQSLEEHTCCRRGRRVVSGRLVQGAPVQETSPCTSGDAEVEGAGSTERAVGDAGGWGADVGNPRGGALDASVPTRAREGTRGTSWEGAHVEGGGGKGPAAPAVPAGRGDTRRVSSSVRKSRSCGGGDGRLWEKGNVVSSKTTWHETMTRLVVRSRLNNQERHKVWSGGQACEEWWRRGWGSRCTRNREDCDRKDGSHGGRRRGCSCVEFW